MTPETTRKQQNKYQEREKTSIGIRAATVDGRLSELSIRIFLLSLSLSLNYQIIFGKKKYKS